MHESFNLASYTPLYTYIWVVVTEWYMVVYARKTKHRPGQAMYKFQTPGMFG